MIVLSDAEDRAIVSSIVCRTNAWRTDRQTDLP